MKVLQIKPPKDWKTQVANLKNMGNKVTTVFTAGSIDMGKAKEWVKVLEDNINDKGSDIDETVVLLNPRRDDWDSSWKQEKENKDFNEQVTWELNGLEKCDIIFLNFTPESKAPISLLELGLFHKKVKIIVVCPKEFYRHGNVDMVCDRYNIKLYETMDEGVNELIKMLS